MPPKKKQAAPSVPARRSSRVAANEAAAEAKMHAEALAATKDWFAEMGKEMQMAEDQEAAELFAQTVMEHEEKTGLVCVMLDSVEDESEDEDEEDDEDDEDDVDDVDDADDSDAEPSEVSGSDSDDADDSDGSDDEEDPLWAPDGMKERLENALKVYVPPNAADALETLQLTLSLAEAVPGVGADLAEKVVDAAAAFDAKKKDADADAAFANAFAATVAMAEADAELTWAKDKKRAAKMLAKLGSTWKALFRESNAENKNKNKARGKKTGLARLESRCVAALETYLGQRCAEKWGAMGLTFDAVAVASGSGKGKKRARAE